MSPSESSTVDTSTVRFAARMPILAVNEIVFGYKLLFRNDLSNFFPSVENDGASRAVIDLSSLIGLNTLANNLPAFIIATRDTLVQEYLTLLPPNKVIAEIPDYVSADMEVLQACKKLRKSGYKIALSNFRATDSREALVETANFLKVNIKDSALGEIALITNRYRDLGLQFIAEKVETREDFAFSKSGGFGLFEGYYFRKPELMCARHVGFNRAVFLRLLGAISKQDLDWFEIEDIVKSDPTLYFRLLRYLNSAIFGLRCEVTNVRMALAFLGENEMRRWCWLSGMLEMSKCKPSDLVLAALVRARFAELISSRLSCSKSDPFQVGLLSLMDAILDIPMREVLDGLSIDEDGRRVLLENKGPLTPVYELLLAMEAGVWSKVEAVCSRFKIDPGFIAQSYWNAMDWGQSVVNVAS